VSDGGPTTTETKWRHGEERYQSEVAEEGRQFHETPECNFCVQWKEEKQQQLKKKKEEEAKAEEDFCCCRASALFGYSFDRYFARGKAEIYACFFLSWGILGFLLELLPLPFSHWFMFLRLFL